MLAQSTEAEATQHATIFWGLLDRPRDNTPGLYSIFQQWKPWINLLRPYGSPPDPPHLTLNYDRRDDLSYEYEYDNEVSMAVWDVTTTNLFVGQAGVAASVELSDEQLYWYRLSAESTPHITLAIRKGYEAKELGPMVKTLLEVEDWEPTQIAALTYSPSHRAYRLKIYTQECIHMERHEVDRHHGREKTDHAYTVDMLRDLPSDLWASHSQDVGFCLKATPVTFEVSSSVPVSRSQYPIKPQAKGGVDKAVEGLKRAGVLEPSQSLWNTPILPVSKSSGEYRMAHDLRTINAITTTALIPVPNPYTAICNVSPEHTWFTCIDLANAFFCIPLAESMRPIFSFTIGGEKLKYTRLPQGFSLSPGIFNKVLREQLEGVTLPVGVVLIQYVDDLLIAAPSAASCLEATRHLLVRLHTSGFKVSKKKLQCTRKEVTFLGRVISPAGTGMSAAHQEHILNHPKPKTVKDMLSFLGLTGYSRHYIPEYNPRTAELRKLINEKGMRNLTATLDWTQAAEAAFISLKQSMSQVTALAAASYALPFFLDVSENEDTVNGILFQKKWGCRTILMYVSVTLDRVENREPPCMRHAAGTARILNKISHIVMGHPLTVLTTHSIVSFVNSSAFTMTSTRQTRLEKTLTKAHITYTHEGVNSADTIGSGEPHRCEERIIQDVKLRIDLRDEPIPQAENLFTDGCCFRHPQNGLQAAYAVVKQKPEGNFEEVSAGEVTGKVSAQLAEVMGVIAALELSKGKDVNIYTDSAYVHGVIHVEMRQWLRAGFVTSTNTPIKHEKEIKRLAEAVMLPNKLALLKCKGHNAENNYLAWGNNAADKAAKEKAGYTPWYQMLVLKSADLLPAITDETLKEAQEAGSPQDKKLWSNRGATNKEGIWYSPDGRPVIPPEWIRSMLKEAHGPTHCGKTQMNRHLTHWWHPYLPDMIANHLEECVICLTHNIRATVKPHQGKFPLPKMAGEEIIIDYTDMIDKVRGFRYLLVVVDGYTGWPEAIPCRREDADSVIKFLVTHYIPLHGFPRKVRSDNGSHFKNHDLRTVEESLGLRHSFGAVYHPQSQGKMERMNQNLKQKLSKACEETGMKWVDALPLALMSIRSSINKGTGFSPFKLTYGHQFPGPGALSVGTEVEVLSSKPYFQQLKGLVADFSTQVAEAKGGPEKHEANTAEFVWLKAIRPKWLRPRFSGPHRVMQRTSHAVRLEGKGDIWYHWNQCAVGKPPGRTLDDIITDVVRAEEEEPEDNTPITDPEVAISGRAEEDVEERP
ncbi:uncharacterized protein LOC117558119 [Gymnodraco acuticeps]|uniref:ribonuclease H n=1 Tax=Gymnodraco acuticeps TaxID=8218 RepID=A0A6P8WR59_GYMAC|nr:uncharacterized protein LOC117558119 [Gymnodraco acuticeps]